jgi:hypothetical protein
MQVKILFLWCTARSRARRVAPETNHCGFGLEGVRLEPELRSVSEMSVMPSFCISDRFPSGEPSLELY